MSPYKDKEAQKKAVAEAVKKHRQGITEGITREHPIMKYLIPGKKREDMEVIVESVRSFNQLENVRFGAGVYSLPLDIAGGMLEATR